ncbi:phosphotransferase [Ancylobacter sp. FA202]|uniref:phosphotransferase n=1 Tax=Ancylobacter sp. FA202 TaxID=1111106 RepID=UPI00036DD77A|nr:phosphotransferase [Ancylobacter sp. FA202]
MNQQPYDLAGLVARFRADISKDEFHRGRDGRSGHVFVKQARDGASARREFEALNLLAHAGGEALVPRPLALRGRELRLELVEGIRLYDLLRLFRQLGDRDVALRERASRASLVLLGRCRARLERMQGLLAAAAGGLSVGPYPCDVKVTGMFAMLSQLLGLPPLDAAETAELGAFEARWAREVSVPFRDATPKNIIVAVESLAIGRHPSEAARRAALARLLEEGGAEFWRSVPLLDIDFSSVEHLTTPEDDLVSLLAHESSFAAGFPAGAKVEDGPMGTAWPDPARAASSFFVRYLRFAGRKVAYRLINPLGGATRFRHDRFGFYFETLPGLLAALDPALAGAMPALLARWSAIGTAAAPFDVANGKGPDLYLQAIGRPVDYWQESPLELPARPALAAAP